MKKILSALALLIFAFASYAQSGQDFPSLGDELLVQKNIVEIYPNPSVDFLNVHIKNADLTNTVLTVYNIIGNKFKIEVEIIEENKYQLDVRDLPSGYYMLSIKDTKSDFRKTFKFLKN